MKKGRSLKTIPEIFAAKSFELLEPYKAAKTWNALPTTDRELLALMFAMQGENALMQTPEGAQSSFDLALKVAPSSPKVLLKIAQAYSKQHLNGLNLLQASRYAEQAVDIDNGCYEGWCCWANILVALATHTKNQSYLLQADEKFAIAETLRQQLNLQDAEFYWHWGVCWHLIAKNSGEAGDYYKAICKYQNAAQEGCQQALFLNDYASALVDLGSLVSRIEFLFEAAEIYKKAIEKAPEFFEGWFNIACTLATLFDETEDNEFFKLSDQSFQTAVQLNEKTPHLWLKWGSLLSLAGKVTKTSDLIEKSLEKFEKADALQPMDSEILSKWAENLLCIGSQTENYTYLKLAEQKITLALKIHPENALHWHIYGQCLNELGRYFQESRYHVQAIEKYQYGLSLNSKNPLLWYGLAVSHLALGEAKQDAPLMEKAAKFFGKVAELSGSKDMPPQFWNEWGVALMKLGELTGEKHYVEEALQKFEEALQQHADDNASIDPEWLYHYGCAHDFLGDFLDDERYYERAVQILSQTLSLFPEFTHARYNLALALSHLGEITCELEHFYKALDLFQETVAADPEDEMAWNDWGLCLLHLAQLMLDPTHPHLAHSLYHQAELKLQHAISLGNAYALYNMACLQSLVGNHTAAIHYLEKSEQAGSLPSLEDLAHDEWLDSLRGTHEYQQFLHHLNSKKHN